MKDSDPPISVLLPVFNGDQFLAEAIESVISQSFTDWEMIIVNDGSTDDTANVIARYLKDKRIRYFVNATNRGYAYTCNRGFNLCKGKYIALQDADDVSTQHRLRLEFGALESNDKCKIAFSRIHYINSQGALGKMWGGVRNSSPVLSHNEYFRKLYTQGNFVPNPSVMIRNCSDDKPKYREDLDVCNDFEFHLRMLHDHDFYYLSQPLVFVRRDDDHTTMTSNREKNFFFEKVILKDIRKIYMTSEKNPITRRMYNACMSNQYLRECNWASRNNGTKIGRSVLISLLFNPINIRTYQFIMRFYGPEKLYNNVRKVFRLIR